LKQSYMHALAGSTYRVTVVPDRFQECISQLHTFAGYSV
jgi:hypothetical protein